MRRHGPQSYADTWGLQLLRELFGAGRFLFTTEEAKVAGARLGLPAGYLSQLLSRLAASGWLRRLRRGLYAGTEAFPGGGQVHPFAIATRLVVPSAISHWSAMNYHGLTEQVARVVTAITPRKVVTPSMRGGRGSRKPTKHTWDVAGVQYTYVSVTPAHFFGIEEVWVDQWCQVPMTDQERTLLDGFVAPRMVGGMGAVLSMLEDHVHHLDLAKLVRYALRYGTASVAKRLGWALEQAQVPASVLAPLQALPVAGFRVLDPTQPARGPCDRRWMLQDNLSARTR
jgi:predicted transcriptional regulator of viral defense system